MTGVDGGPSSGRGPDENERAALRRANETPFSPPRVRSHPDAERFARVLSQRSWDPVGSGNRDRVLD